MAAPCFVIGVDGGTEGLRAGVFNAYDGTLLGTCSATYPTYFPAPSWAEQDPESWWTALGTAVRGALAAAKVPGESIAGFAADTTCCSVCCLDADGRPLRNALIWMDQRSSKEAAEVAATKDPAIKVNSGGRGPVSAEWMVCKSRWLKSNDPQSYHAARYICEYQDFFSMRLTGKMVASINCASVRWHYDCSTPDGYALSLLDKMDLQDLAGKWPKKVLALGEIVGGLTAEAAAHLGLVPGTPVAQGGADSFIGMIGLGVVEPGQMALLTGSSHLQLGMVSQALRGQGIFGTYDSAVIPGLHVVEGGQTSTGSIVHWLKRTLCGPDVTYDTLNAEAEEVPPGCDGLLALDHFQGNRTPHTDPLSRGCLVGLTLAHTRGHVYRALMESVVFGTRRILDNMAAAGARPTSINIAGGSTKSELWLQMHADVCNIPFVQTAENEAPMLGAAVLAAVAVGCHPDGIAAGAQRMVRTARVIYPRPEMHAAYEPHFQRYCQLYPALAPVFHAAHTSTQTSTSAPEQQQQQQQQPQERQCTDEKSKEASRGQSVLQGIVAPSILAADFSRLGEEVESVLCNNLRGWVHVDVFDGSAMCNGNLTIGPPVISSLRAAHPAAFLDVHLAVDEPCKYVDAVVQAGASSVTFHLESPSLRGLTLERLKAGRHGLPAGSNGQQGAGDPATGFVDNVEGARVLASYLKSLGVRVGVALNPDTPETWVLPLIQEASIDLVLAMTVNPGWGGQSLIESVLTKVSRLREASDQFQRSIDIQVDGGISSTTASRAVASGANILVAGSAIFSRGRAAPSKDARAVSYANAISAIAEPLSKKGYAVQ
uniref:glycerol kinase n=1 Tax=Dunaliella tertiolecta TaxID=3047 RepID=A0A7S3VPG9_DUNTE|eukprot:CAMPEP_0202394130 /NCGR_PEP_ID=MMETSP1127-20130417/93269_1 /ASSEMBLY_ACC=CAM_ASM_000462 /TAXON_ID=3047 /ORGANISM="Dunaliella tertiolecta, Strain CCMP1320" /LENGTH=825 /DNA_ID=CAMNT_0048996739 /DNA_START=58 /DNA_END=2535 /DNA_ORIENTATION=+